MNKEQRHEESKEIVESILYKGIVKLLQDLPVNDHDRIERITIGVEETVDNKCLGRSIKMDIHVIAVPFTREELEK